MPIEFKPEKPLSEAQTLFRDMLTLRYHPDGNVLSLPKLGWQDFQAMNGVESAYPAILQSIITYNTRKMGDGDIGVGISGGLDSTTMLALLRLVHPKLEVKTFCITLGNDEREVAAAQAVSDLYDTDHKHIVIENPLAEIDRLVKIAGSPRWNLYPFYLFEAAKKAGCKMLLTGDGGDEMLGGYTFRYRHMSTSRDSYLPRRYLEAHKMDWVDEQKEMFAFPFRWQDIYRLLEPNFRNPLPVIAKTFLADYHGKLMYDFAPTANAFAKYTGVSYLAPMLDPVAVYFAAHLPYSLKYDPVNNIGKIMLRQILLGLSAFKPASGGKIGWGGDLKDLWDIVRKQCDPATYHFIFEHKIIRGDWASKAFWRAESGDVRYISKLLQICALEAWLRQDFRSAQVREYKRK